MVNERVLNKQKLVAIAKRHRIAYLALWGSPAQKEAQSGNDVELYIRFGRRIGVFEMLGIKHEMEHALGLNVDLIAEEIVDPDQLAHVRVAKDLVVLYEYERELHGAAQ